VRRIHEADQQSEHSGDNLGQTITVHSTAKVVGPYDATTGKWRGEGTVAEGPYRIVEVYDGIWWNRNGNVQLEGTLNFTYQYPMNCAHG